MLISVQNNLPDLETTQFSYTAGNVTIGATSIPVRNINPFSADSAIQLGKTGEAQSEIRMPSFAADGTVVVNSPLLYNHSLDTPVFDILFDQIVFKRSTSGTAGTAVAVGTVNITPNSEYTDFDDVSGLSTYAYKTQFRNSSSGYFSSESDWFIPGGPTFYSLQALRGRVKAALFNANYLKDDEIINDWINEWAEQMTNSAIKINQGYSIGTVDVGFGTAGLGTITSSDFKTLNEVELSYDGVNYADPTQGLSWEGDTVFKVVPEGTAGTARLTYSKLPTRLVNDADELPLSLRSYTTSCIEYVLYRAFDNDQKRDYATDHYQKFAKLQNDFIREITPRDFTGPRIIDLTEELSGNDTDYELL